MRAHLLAGCAALVLIAGCGGNVGQKVKYDFGIGEAPEGHVSVTDRIMERLPEVGATEMQRFNAESRQGEIVFVQEDEFRGKFHKEVRVYERAIPIEAKAAPRTASQRDTRNFYGYVDYIYNIYRGPGRDSRAEAQADSATIPTGESGRVTYRYKFGSSGSWNGGRGHLVR